jgi:hypothetical protein
VPDKTTPYNVADGVFDALARNPRTSATMASAITRRYANSQSFDNTRAAFILLETIPKATWTDAMVEQVERAPTLNTQVGHAGLPGGRAVPEAAQELLNAIRGDSPPLASGDDDIAF